MMGVNGCAALCSRRRATFFWKAWTDLLVRRGSTAMPMVRASLTPIFASCNSVRVKPRPARTRRLCFCVAHRTIERRGPSAGRGPTSLTFLARFNRRDFFLPVKFLNEHCYVWSILKMHAYQCTSVHTKSKKAIIQRVKSNTRLTPACIWILRRQ